jgi:two-component system CheB/CheR fusion protein
MARDDDKLLDPVPPSSSARLLIVGVGASAGGLEAFSRFLANVPAHSGLAFVLVQHLDPEHQSMLVELLGRHTAMPVTEAKDGIKLAADQVVVIPPNATLTIAEGRLHVTRPAPPRAHRRPIDTFFESLATDQGENAVCVVLSGTGSDGAAGTKAIKARGGLAIAQAESGHTAMSGMPQSAVATGQVDYVLPVEDIPAQLVDYQQHMHVVARHKDSNGDRRDAADRLDEISELIRVRTGHDFSGYKDNTRVRRVQRRMQVLQIDHVEDYVERLRAEPAERDTLFHELLISVTQFFRDPKAWQALETRVIPALVENRHAGESVRVWVAGCGTGEEAYSIAILLAEALSERDIAPSLQVFGTDLDAEAIQVARSGWYAPSMGGLSAAHIKRWFVPQRNGYTPIKALRETCIFSEHNLDQDPPFSKLDLIICRNVLIYMGRDLQDRVLRKFHYGLRAQGTLFLGQSENVSSHSTLFDTVDKTCRLFQRRDAHPPMPVDVSTRVTPPNASAHSAPADKPADVDALDHAVRRVMEPYAPAYLVIDRQYEIQRFSGGTAGHYLEPASGAASLQLFDLVKKALRPAVREAVQRAFANRHTVQQDDLAVRVDGRGRAVTLIVEPLAAHSGHGECCVVAFRDAGPLTGQRPPEPSREADGQTSALEQELQVTRTQLRAASAELDRAQEETRSVTEEYQSVNEELQASNEELETSKEEMQSINEELETVNTELSDKNQRLATLNSDLRNLLESTQVATIFLDNDLRIKNFTPGITELFHLRETDYGRPITDLVSRLNYHELADDVATVQRKLTVVEREVALSDGTTYVLHIRLYRTVANVIEGVVLTFFDITERKRFEAQRAWLASIVDASVDAIISQDQNACITSWNAAAERIFGLNAQEAIGSTLAEQLGPYIDPSTRNHIDQRLGGFKPWETEMQWRRDQNTITLALSASPITDNADRVVATSIIARDISGRVAQAQQRELLLQELNHRVKNVLATVQSIMMQTQHKAPAEFRDAFAKRIQALAQTHNLLTRSQWRGVSLRELLEAELRPYGDEDNPRWHLSGEAVALGPDEAVALGLAFHELTTNAAKYGALATQTGRLVVHWHVTEGSEGHTLNVAWLERGGPAAHTPRRQGFGLRLIQEGLAHELEAQVQLDFEPEGLRCALGVPLRHPDEPESAYDNPTY